MKKFVKLTCIALVLALCVLFSACNPSDYGNQFGEFGYNGKALVEYAVQAISANKAKDILPLCDYQPVASLSMRGVVSNADENNQLSQSVINKVLSQYAGCNITTEYYLEDSDKVNTKVDTVVGTDFKSMLKANQFVPFNQLVAKNVIAYDELVDYMEKQNQAFANSEESLVAPFKTIFSYHVDQDGRLVIQSRDFAEIASSVGGGVGCSYRQDTEIVYDEQGKMTLWQTSLGISTSAPQGTMKQGYILKVQVEWIAKV